MTQLAGNAQAAASGTLAGAPANVAPFVLTDRLDRTRFKIAPSLTISRKDRYDVRVGADYDVSAGAHGFNAFVQIGKKY